MSPKDVPEVIANARRAAMLQQAKTVHKAAFASEVTRARAAVRDDPITAEHVQIAQGDETALRKTLAQLAKHNGTTAAKALAEAVDEHERELRENLTAWEDELAIIEDMIEHPGPDDVYGGRLLDGRPLVVKDLQQGVLALRATIKQARVELGIEDDKSTKRARGGPKA